ncbi:Hint domain-containing protein [Sulfitobacter guttiformis]|nr:Hint domain-containing protein [Sulfitobacter guttiformis]
MAKINVTQSGMTTVVGQNDNVSIDIFGGGDTTIVANPNESVSKIKLFLENDNHSDKITIDLSTFSQNGLRIDIHHYDPTDIINLQGAFNRYVDPDNPDEYTFDYIGADGRTYSATIYAKDGGEKDFTSDPSPIIICFAKGTEIETSEGAQAIETLCVGDLIRTLDAGFVPLKWLGRTDMGARELRRWENLRPVRVRSGAFGQGRPEKDVVLSPNHRVLIGGKWAELYFGEAEVLVPVKALVDGIMIYEEKECTEITYFHLLLEGHHIVETSGLLSESLFLGVQSMQAVSKQADCDLRSTLTEFEWQQFTAVKAARPIIRAQLGQFLAA